MFSYAVSTLEIPFTHSVQHNNSTRKKTQSILVAVSCTDPTKGAMTTYGEACPRSYVTQETLASCRSFLNDIRQNVKEIHNLHSLTLWVNNNAKIIDANPAAWCALETALLDLFAKQLQVSVETLLSISPIHTSPTYSGVISDGSNHFFNAQLDFYQQHKITDIKLKLSGQKERDLQRLKTIKETITNTQIRVDANNLFNTMEDALQYMSVIGDLVWAVEEPFQSKAIEQSVILAGAADTKVILDESFISQQQLDQISPQQAAHVIPNLRISKHGGILRTLNIARACTNRGLMAILGAHVGETSLLTRTALPIAQCLGPNLVAMEGAFSDYLLQSDPFRPKLRFSTGGQLSYPLSSLEQQAGFGMALSNNF